MVKSSFSLVVRSFFVASFMASVVACGVEESSPEQRGTTAQSVHGSTSRQASDGGVALEDASVDAGPSGEDGGVGRDDGDAGVDDGTDGGSYDDGADASVDEGSDAGPCDWCNEGFDGGTGGR
jgi:hypothetical protein